MKSRQEIKVLGKQAFQSCYWLCVAAFIICAALVGVLGVTYVGVLILGGPLIIGFNFLWISVFMGRGADIGNAFTTTFTGFDRKLGGYMWMVLFLILWSLIPVAGIVIVIVKTLSYYLAPYILADCPNVRGKDALTLSKRLMQGHKADLFVFLLSYIGWDILSVLTAGLLEILYVGPWKKASLAGWYLELREQALRDGTVTADELNGGILRENAGKVSYTYTPDYTAPDYSTPGENNTQE